MAKKFLFSVANVVGMVGNEVLFTAKTLSDTSISVDASNTEVRGGQGNALQTIYYHTETMNVNLTDVQFRLPFIAAATGTDIVNVGTSVAGNKEGNFWTTETVTLVGMVGTLSSNSHPAQVRGQDLSVYVEVDGEWKTLALDSTAKTFDVTSTGIAANSTICVMYLDQKDVAKQITIPSDFIPKRVHLYLTAKLFGDVSGTGDVGKIQIEIPVAQIGASLEISMTAEGTANTPLTAMALAYTDEDAIGCSEDSFYAKITEYTNNSVWYEGVDGIYLTKDTITLVNSATEQLVVYARKGSTTFQVNNANLTFTSSATGKATVGEHTGLVTAAASGTGTATITAKLMVDGTVRAQDSVTVEVTAAT